MIKDAILNKEIEGFDKLKLVLLFSLRYDGDAKVDELTKELENEKIPNTHLIGLMTKYAGKEKRNLGLSSETGLMGRFTKAIKETFKGIPNVFTQHKSLMFSVVETAINGTLKDLDYPATSLEAPREKINDIIVFIVGGATYQEAREVAEFNSKGGNIVLGGTNMYNSTSFLADITFLYGQPATSPTVMAHAEEFKSF